jgi:hypothetical protein
MIQLGSLFSEKNEMQSRTKHTFSFQATHYPLPFLSLSEVYQHISASPVKTPSKNDFRKAKSNVKGNSNLREKRILSFY